MSLIPEEVSAEAAQLAEGDWRGGEQDGKVRSQWYADRFQRFVALCHGELQAGAGECEYLTLTPGLVLVARIQFEQVRGAKIVIEDGRDSGHLDCRELGIERRGPVDGHPETGVAQARWGWPVVEPRYDSAAAG